MDSLAAQSTAKLVVVVAICVAAALWMLAVITNFRGYGDRTFQRALQAGAQARQRGFPTERWSNGGHRTRVLKAMRLVCVWVLLLAVTTFGAYAATALIVQISR